MGNHALSLVVPTFAAFLFSIACVVKAGELSTSNCLPHSVAHPTAQACHPLHDAVKADNIVLVKLRLTEGADVNEVDLFGTPLHYAAARNSADIAKVLIDAGAKLEAEAVEDQRRAHPLHTAARGNAVEVAEFLVGIGAQLNARDADGATPLSVAASYGNAKIVEVLLKAGADALAEDSFNRAPIHNAAKNCRLDVVQLLLSNGVDINLRNSQNGWTPLHEATQKDCVELVEFLLARGADPNIADKSGNTPLQISDTAGCSRHTRDLLLRYGAKK